jgi:hypothetical protein
MIAAVVGVHPAQAQEMTAGLILTEMPTRERGAYVLGIVEGLAYARFRKDTIASGASDATGAKCIYDWFYKDTIASYDRIEAAFRKYPDQFPSTLLAVLIKKECGE